MPALILDPMPPQVEALIERRREWGADHHDEVWEGVLHMSPQPSVRHELIVNSLRDTLEPLAADRGMAAIGAAGIGVKNDCRIPDLTLLRPPLRRQWQPTAALAVEVLSQRDPPEQKLPFYASHDVDEVVIVDPAARAVAWLALGETGYAPVERSAVVELSAAELAARIEWEPSFTIAPDDR